MKQLPDIEKMRVWIRDFLHKYQYLLLAGAVGLLLLLWPSGKQNSSPSASSLLSSESKQEGVSESSSLQSVEDIVEALEEELETILHKTRGVGKVRVLLTLSSSTSRIPARDISRTETRSQSDTGTTDTVQEEERHVLVSDGNGAEEPVILQENAAVFRGAVVLCQGADSASVRLAVLEAVCAVTGLGADAIAVLPMD